MQSEESRNAALAWLENNPQVESVRVAICDLNGVMRGKRIAADQARKALDGGMRMAYSLIGMDIWGEDIEGNPLVYSTGDSDAVCHWTGRPIVPVDWTPLPTALIPLTLAYDDGRPFPGDPRQALAEIQRRYAARGLTPVVATELEFYLFDAASNEPVGPVSPVNGRRLNADGALSIDELDAFETFISEVYAACRAQNIPVDTTIAENGVGQFEINLNHVANALKAADDAILFKRVVRGIARKHGFIASFMAKPYGDRAGSGLHVHFSLLDGDGNNVFDDGTEKGTDIMRHAVGGLLRGMAQSTLIFAPHFNSYRRLRPKSYAPTAVAWGYENRMVAIRIPGGSHKARRIEHRVAGADANPYLVLASVLGSALIGMEEACDPGQPIAMDVDSHDLPRLPSDWLAAIAAFEQGKLMQALFAPELRDAFVACKQQEADTFARKVGSFELETYMEMV
ncbi:glutamine synthetase family protein [Aquamicrobium sp. NLF2-7]|uniref:glutamine synthetase family protein n=1 Tax=Aquamicrobium sp. NLF2-7 TaxID=2918753 RepID=UPI001EFB20E0|nr:glutamine synthetase family protein [Aquamicrobium sp. NLF2-7]MCG8273479.1 glutamine synthetase family protein [Aquamicrobium sp. NLF2-7]